MALKILLAEDEELLNIRGTKWIRPLMGKKQWIWLPRMPIK